MLSFGANPVVKRYGFYLLNAFRVGNIAALLTVGAASWIMIISTGIKNNFFFFDAATHFLVFVWAFFLFLSECNVPRLKTWIHQTWPVLSHSHSLGWLGIMMLALSCQVLGNLNKPQYSLHNLGLPMWRAVLASGILSMTFGMANLVVSVIFRDPDGGITARMIRSDGAVAQVKEDPVDFSWPKRSSPSLRSIDEKPDRRFKRMTNAFMHPFGGGKKPQISHPMPHTHQDDVEAGHSYSNEPAHSYDINNHNNNHNQTSPIISGYPRPPSPLHPAHKGRGESTYSVARMTQFDESSRYDDRI